MLASEKITMRTFKDYHDENPNMFTDDFLRDNSYRLEQNNITSKAEYRLPSDIQKIEFHLRNNFEVNGATFKIQLTLQENEYRVIRLIWRVISSLFSLMLCCVCLAACLRCWGKNGAQGDGVYDRDFIDPNWDEDQVRSYQARSLQRRLSNRANQNRDGAQRGQRGPRRLASLRDWANRGQAHQDSSSSEDSEEISEQLKKVQEEIIKKFIESLETFKYDESLNEFGT